jgi:hypothetical protein
MEIIFNGNYEKIGTGTMSYGDYPYENNYDHLYGIDEQEDRWEQQYADYLEDQIELQHVAEMDAEYAASMGLLDEPYREGVHIDSGDTSFVSQAVRDQMARRDTRIVPEELESDSVAHQLLHLPLGDNDAQAATVGEYLGLLLSTLWLQADGFSAKRPFGNSDWQYVIYMAMVKAGLATGVVYEEDGFEYLDEIDEVAADEIILQAIRLAYNHGK